MKNVSRSFAKTFILGWFLFGSSAMAQGITLLNSNEGPTEIVTTVSEVVLDEDGDELLGANIYADNDRRLLYIEGDRRNELHELMNARRNGWEVRLELEEVAAKNAPSANSLTVVGVEILSRENKLTTGLLYTPKDSLKPIVAKSYYEIFDLFDSVYPYDSRYYDVNDDCFNRAQYWSRTLQHGQAELGDERRTDKVFIFFSQAYTKKFDHNWWYHVAPVVYYGDEDTPWAFDPTFVDEPVTLKEWLYTFDQNTDGNCKEISSVDEYYAYNGEPICMYVVASMYNYVPSDLRFNRRLNNWRCGDFRGVMGIPAPGSRTNNSRASWNDPIFSYLLPDSCR